MPASLAPQTMCASASATVFFVLGGLDDLGIDSTSTIGVVAAVAGAATVLGSVVFARLPQRRRLRLPALFAWCAAGFLLMGLADSLPLLITGAVINCVGTGMLLPSLVTRAMSRLEFADRGRGMGLWTAAFFLGQFLCPLVLLAGKGAVGSLAVAVAALGAATAITAALLLPAARRNSADAEVTTGDRWAMPSANSGVDTRREYLRTSTRVFSTP